MSANFFPEEIEYYIAAEELLAESDLTETDCHITGWSKKFRIRALSFGSMDEINQNAIDDKGNLIEAEHICWTIVKGVVRPAFTIDQARRLKDKNGDHVKELSDQIWAIGRLNKAVFDNFMKEQTALIKAQEEEDDELQEENDKEKKSYK